MQFYINTIPLHLSGGNDLKVMSNILPLNTFKLKSEQLTEPTDVKF